MSTLAAASLTSHNEAVRMQRWQVKMRSKRGLALRDVFIVAQDEYTARHRVQQMYLLSDIVMISPSSESVAASLHFASKR